MEDPRIGIDDDYELELPDWPRICDVAEYELGDLLAAISVLISSRLAECFDGWLASVIPADAFERVRGALEDGWSASLDDLLDAGTASG